MSQKKVLNVLIAKVVDPSKVTEVTGYAVLTVGMVGADAGKFKVRLVSADKAAQVFVPGAVENAVYDKAKKRLTGTNGALDRYSSYGAKGVANKLVVVARIADGFIMTDSMGTKVVRMPDKDAVAAADLIGIANGKVVTKGDRRFISAISGEYETYPEIYAVAPKAVEKAGGKQVAKAKETDHSKAFYELVATTFGAERAHLVKYLVEEKQTSTITGFANVIQLTKGTLGIAATALHQISVDAIAGIEDEKLMKKALTLVEKDAIKAMVAYAAKTKATFFDIWDANDEIYPDPNGKYDITAETVRHKIEDSQK